MRRSWTVGVIAPLLFAFGTSGCATNQKRLTSNPAPQFQEGQPSDSGRRLFSWGWWSKPKAKADPVLAQHDLPVQPDASTTSSSSEFPSTDPWPEHKNVGLSKYFPSFGRRSPSNTQNSTPVLGAPTASRGTSSRDRGVRQVNANADETDAAPVSPSRRPADDPPLLPVPIQLPTPEHNRPNPTPSEGIDLGVAGANESISDSAAGKGKSANRASDVDQTDEEGEAAPAPGLDHPATLLDPNPGSDDKALSKLSSDPVPPVADPVGQKSEAPAETPVKTTQRQPALPSPTLPEPSLPPATQAASEPASAPASLEWPAGIVEASNESTAPAVVSKEAKAKPVEAPPNSKPVASADTNQDAGQASQAKEKANPVTAAAPAVPAEMARPKSLSSTEEAPKSPEVRRTTGVKVAQLDQAPPAPAIPLPPNPSIPSVNSPAVLTTAPPSIPQAVQTTVQAATPQGGLGTPQATVLAQASDEGHGWGLGLFSGKLLPCLKKKFHHDTPTVLATPQIPTQTLFPQAYFECSQTKPTITPTAQVAVPSPQVTVPTPQAPLPSAQAPATVAKKKCEWLEKCKVIQAVKDWKAHCKIKMCPCCSGGHKSAHCAAGATLASPQGSVPVSSPQAQADTSKSAGPESGDLAKGGDVIQRVSAEGVDESPQR